MRTDDIAFLAQNSAPFASPRYVIEISFAFDNSVLYYLTSHDGTPTPNSGNTISGVVEKIAGTSQKLDVAKFNSTIGGLSVDVADVAEAVTNLLRAQDVAGRSLTKKRLRVYMGFEGLEFAKFALIQTQVIQGVELQDGGIYKISAQDVQRETRKQIFEVKETALTANIAEGATSISVQSTAGFEMVAHGTGWGDAPNATVGYLYIENNDDWSIARYTGKTSTTFTGITWTSFGSRARQFLIVDGEQTNEITVRELVYIELPAVKLAYALLTGTLYGQAGAFLPDHWHCGVSTQYVSTSHFTTIGADLWNTTNDAVGPRLRFLGVQNEDGRAFIQQDVLPAINCFMPVLSTGELALKRLQPVLSTSATITTLDRDSVASAGNVKYALDDVANKYRVDWAWDFREERFRRSNMLFDNVSIAKHGESSVKTLDLKGVHGSVHSVDYLRAMFDGFRDRFAGPPITLTLDLLPMLNTLEVGDVVRVDLSHLPDYTGDDTLNRAFEVQAIKVDWLNGRVSVDLFGSTQKAAPLTEYGSDSVNPAGGNAIADSWYALNGTNIETAFAGSVSRSGSTVTLTSDITLTGGALLAFLGVLQADCVFYVLGDFVIPAGRTITINNNVCIKVRGFFTVDGKIDGKGRGIAGGDHRRWAAAAWGQGLHQYYVSIPIDEANGTYPVPATGLVHSSLAGGVAAVLVGTRAGITHGDYVPALSALPESQGAGAGFYSAVPALNLMQDVAPADAAYMAGVPHILVGGGGQAGGSIYVAAPTAFSYNITPLLHGADGGAGGAGLAIFARGMDFGASGQIDVSGNDAAQNQQKYAGTWASIIDQADTLSNAFNVAANLYASPGAGGAPGCVCVFIDGAENVAPTQSGQAFVAFYGRYMHAGASGLKTYLWDGTPDTQLAELPGGDIELATAWRQQHPAGNQWLAHTRVQILAAPVAPVDDTPVEADAVLSITLTEHTNTPVTPRGDQSTIDVEVTPPADPNYSYSWAEFRRLGTTAWSRIPAPAQTETTFTVATDGGTYQVRALAVSKNGIVARTGPIAQITLTNFASNPAAVRAAGGVFDLRVAGQAVGANTFNTRDLAVTWAYESALGIDYVLDDWFSHFRVVVRNGSTVVGTFETTSPVFTLTAEQNAALNSGTPFATVSVEVRQVTADGSLGNANTVTFTNAAPAAPTSVTTVPSDYGTVIRWANPAVADLLRVELHISLVNGFTPSAATLYFSGLAQAYTPAALHPDTLHYGAIRAVDAYGNVSGYTSFSFTTADVDPNLKNENQNWSDINDDNGQMPAPNADVTADSAAHQALESAVADLEQQVASLGGTGFNIVLPAYGNFEGTPALAAGNGTVATTTEAYRFQARSLKFTPSAADNYCYLGASATDYNTPISPSSKWILSCYVMAPVGTSVPVQLRLRTSAAGTYYLISATTDAVAGVWKRVYGLIDLSADASDATVVRLDDDGGAGVVVYFDALQLERYIGSDTNPPPSAYKDPIESVANSAAFQSLSQTVTNQGTTIASHTSQLSGISSTLTTKADQSWVNTQIAAAAPNDLADINPTEAAKLAGISAGADVTANSAVFQAVQSTVDAHDDTLATHSSQLTLMSDSLTLSRTAAANILPNGLLTSEASDGRPANVFAAYGSSVVGNIAFLDAVNKTGLKLSHASDTSIGAAFGAIPVQQGVPMVIRIRVKASVASSSGFYFRMQEYDSTSLPSGARFISSGAASSEAGAVEDTREITTLRENTAITTSWVTHVFTYTPTSTARWVSPLFLRWTGMGSAELHVDYCLVIPNAIQFVNAQMAQLLDQRITATEAGVTSASQSVTTLSNSVNAQFAAIPAAIDAAIESPDLELYNGTVLPAQNTMRRIAFQCDNNSANVHVWYKLLEFTIPTVYSNASISGRVRYGSSIRFENSQDVHARLSTYDPITSVGPQFAINNVSTSGTQQTLLRVFRENNGATNQKLVVYCQFASWAGLQALLDVLMANSATGSVQVWQHGLQVSINNASYLPPGIEITPTYNRGIQDGADVTASSAAHAGLVSRVTATENSITSIAGQYTALESRVDDAEAAVDISSEAIDGIQAHHTINVQAASGGALAVTGIKAVASVANGTPESSILLAANSVKFIRDLANPATDFALTYDSTIGKLTVPAASIGNAQIADLSVQNAKIANATLGRVKLQSGTLGTFYRTTRFVGTGWTGSLNLTTTDVGNVINTSQIYLYCGRSDAGLVDIILDVSFDICRDVSALPLSVVYSDATEFDNDAGGAGALRLQARLDDAIADDFVTDWLVPFHFTEIIDIDTIRRGWLTQRAGIPAHGIFRVSTRRFIQGVAGNFNNIFIRTMPTQTYFRLRNVEIVANVLNRY